MPPPERASWGIALPKSLFCFNFSNGCCINCWTKTMALYPGVQGLSQFGPKLCFLSYATSHDPAKWHTPAPHFLSSPFPFSPLAHIIASIWTVTSLTCPHLNPTQKLPLSFPKPLLATLVRAFFAPLSSNIWAGLLSEPITWVVLYCSSLGS